MFQEDKLKDEIQLLHTDIQEQDMYVERRKTEIAALESLISQYREGYNQYKLQRDKLQDERKYVFFL